MQKIIYTWIGIHAFILTFVYFASVDTGWVTDMRPKAYAERNPDKYPDPLDCIDGAARVLDPVFMGIKTGKNMYGKFLKDYKVSEW